MPLGDSKEAEMKPTPRSGGVGFIADSLMAARDWADKAQVPESVPLLGGQGLGSLVLGKAPEELNEMSYGNMPMRINPLAGRTASFIPEIKQERKEQVADLALLSSGVPSATKAAVKGATEGAKFIAPKANEMLSSYMKRSGMMPELTAYHGTPYKFAAEENAPLGKFRSEKIGTGEGAQAYGFGLYLAESPNVAKKYAVDLSTKGEGYVYTVDIPDKMIGKMLDWDKPLSKQPEAAKTFKKLGIDVKDKTGGEAYKELSDKLLPPLPPDPPGIPRGWGISKEVMRDKA
jgi:hypothetical protein